MNFVDHYKLTGRIKKIKKFLKDNPKILPNGFNIKVSPIIDGAICHELEYSVYFKDKDISVAKMRYYLKEEAKTQGITFPKDYKLTFWI